MSQTYRHVFENTHFTFFQISKEHALKVVKASKSLVINASKLVHIGLD